MYSGLLNVLYSEARDVFKAYIGNDSAKRIITLKNIDSLDTLSNNSDILLYYNVLQNSTPLLLVERMSRKEARKVHAKREVRKMKHSLHNYVANYKVSDDKKFVDIIVMKGNVYENLMADS